MEEGMGEWIRRQQAARPRQFRSDRSPTYLHVFEATMAALRDPSWEAAHARLRPRLDAVLAGRLSGAVVDRYVELVKQLYLLARVHGKLGFERAHAKVLNVTNAMGQDCNMPNEVVIALLSVFEDSVLPAGALEHVVTGGWKLPPEEVPALLLQYGWKDDAKREHMQFLLCMLLRAVSDFRSEMQHTMELQSAIEMESRLSRAQERVNNETQRAMRKHGRALPAANAAGLQKEIDSIVSELSKPCVERIHLAREGDGEGDVSTAAADDEVARFAQRLEAAHID